MRVEVRRRGVKVTEELRTYLDERLRFDLGRFAGHIALVRVYLRSGSGPRGGPGKKCRLVVELPPRGRVVVASSDTDLCAAISRTTSRAGFAVKRYVKRRWTRRRPLRRALRRESGAAVWADGMAPASRQSARARRGKGGVTRRLPPRSQKWPCDPGRRKLP